jgi:hypothetical protein
LAVTPAKGSRRAKGFASFLSRGAKNREASRARPCQPRLRRRQIVFWRGKG